MSTIPVSKMITVTLSVAATPPQTPTFSRGLIVGKSTRLPTSDRLRLYDDMIGVAADFQASDEEYKAATVWFSQSPKPGAGSLMIGRRILTASAGTLTSVGASATLSDYTSITNGGFDLTIDGTLEQLTGLNFSTATTVGGATTSVRSILQTALDAAATGATCTYDAVSGELTIVSPTTGAASIVGYAVAPTGSGTPVDISATPFGFTAAAGASKVLGLAAEVDGGTPGAGITATLTALRSLDTSWYGFHLTADAVAADQKGAMAFAESSELAFYCTESSVVAYDSGGTADLGYYSKSNAYSHTAVQWSDTNPYAAVSLMARALIVNYSQPNSTITLVFKQQPGVVAVNLTTSQYAALDAKRYNYLATCSNGFVMIFNGITGSGQKIDEVMNLDWLRSTAQANVFTAIATAPTKIPQTDRGVQRGVVKPLEETFIQAVGNGCLAPAVWNGDSFGELKTGDLLDKGYYIYAAPVSSQSANDRATRVSPPVTCAVTGAGALEGANILINFQR
jgi:hypothetical protein